LYEPNHVAADAAPTAKEDLFSGVDREAVIAAAYRARPTAIDPTA
jgi:hypothetical protein